MKNVLILIRREFFLFWQNKVFVIAFLFMPLLLALVLGFVYSQGSVKKLPIVIVDKDQSPLSTSLYDMLSENETLNVVYKSHETADLHQTMLDKRAVALLVIPYRFEAFALLNKRPEINCYLNMANTLTAGAAGSAIQLCVSAMNAELQIASIQHRGLTPGLAIHQYEFFHHNSFRQFNPAGNYLLFLWPGLIFSLLHQLLLLATAVGFSQEFIHNNFNKKGILKYTRSATILIFVKTVPYLLMSLITISIYYLLGLLFKIPAPAHPGLLFLSGSLMALSTCLLGIFYSIIFPHPLKASQTLMSVASPAFSISGFTWPSDQMPVILMYIANIIPLTPFLKIVRLIWLQGATFREILPYINHQLILTGAFLILGILLLTKKIRKEIRPDRFRPALG